jgi:site-specific DNA-methyltransferase (adenine-specific)
VKPYYEHAGITIYHGDCREVLPTIPAGTVDLVLTDPPYGIGEAYASHDDSQDNLGRLVSEVMPLILAAAPVALITPGVGNLSLYPSPEWVLAWVTPAGAGSGPWGFCCWQPVLAYGKCPYLANGLGRRQDYFEQTEQAEINGHPCPKPLGVWKKILVRGSVNEGDMVLDPFMGSGTTLRAAKDSHRRAIGIEIEERYCEIAAKRLAQEVLPL